MVLGCKAREAFTKILKEWDMHTIDPMGQSGGLLSAWNPKKR